MTISKITDLMVVHTEKIAIMLKVSELEVQSWIDNPQLILDLGVIEVNKISYCIGINVLDFIKTFEDELPADAWD